MDNKTINFERANFIDYRLDLPLPNGDLSQNSVRLREETLNRLNQAFNFNKESLIVLVYNPEISNIDLTGTDWQTAFLNRYSEVIKLGVKQKDGIDTVTRAAIDFFIHKFKNNANKCNLLLYAKCLGYLNLAGVITAEKNMDQNKFTHNIYYSVNPYWDMGKEKTTSISQQQR